MRIISMIGGLLLAAIVVAFALSNRQEVLLGLWPLTDGVAMPLYLAIIGALLLGCALGWLWAGLRALRRRNSQKKATP